MDGSTLALALLGVVVVVGATAWGGVVARRAKRLNVASRCGRCGSELDGLTSDQRVSVGGKGKPNVLVCNACRSTIRRNYLVAGLFFGLLVVLGVIFGIYAQLVHK